MCQAEGLHTTYRLISPGEPCHSHGMSSRGTQGRPECSVCRQHPWFTLHLPRYLAVMQADTIANTAMLDEDILHEVVKLGFKRQDVVKSIQKRSQNKVRKAFACLPQVCWTSVGMAVPLRLKWDAMQHTSPAQGL